MLTPKISGIFDCRKYDQSGKKAHDQREMLADTDNVTFSVLQPICQVSECFMSNGQLDEFARPRVSKREREAAAAENRQEVEDVVSIKFKVGSNCKWFDRYARPMDRPTNEELEKNRWMAQLDFTKKEKDQSKYCEGKGPGTTCKVYFGAECCYADRRGGGKVCVRREGSCYRSGCDFRRKGYYCRESV